MNITLSNLGVLALVGIGLVLLLWRAPLATRDTTTPSYWQGWRRIRRWIGVLALIVVLVEVAGRFTK